MILDEIYDNIKRFRDRDEGIACPFPKNCDYCRLIFREINIPKNKNFLQNTQTDYDGSGWPDCPCLQLKANYVKSEMRRLFP